MAKKYYFNWYDLLLKTKRDNDSIIILTYASTFGYNKKVANSMLVLLTRLYLQRAASELTKYISINKNTFQVFNNYKMEEPQSYFINKSFLYSKVHVISKIQYLWLLSHRKNDDDNSFIYKDYLSKEELDGIKKNPFITISEDKVNFIFETT